MKRFLTIALAASLGLFVYAGSASAATGTMGTSASGYTSGMSANGVVRSKHNLGIFSGVGPGGFNPGPAAPVGALDGTTQICVFCHTPHHTNTSAKPLWNRDTSNSTSYISYGSTIAGNTPVGGASVTGGLSAGSVSIACLSCHDGVTTFDSLVNAPGAGGGQIFDGTGSNEGWSFYKDAGEGGGPHPNHVMGVIKIGSDLGNDHPVNIVYNEKGSANQAASLRLKTTQISTIDLSSGLSNTNSLTTYYKWMTQNLWANGGFLDASATIQDLLRTDGASNVDLVECSSCHDPHFSNRSYVDYNVAAGGGLTGVDAAEADGVFLRRVGGNTGSGVCRTCHDK